MAYLSTLRPRALAYAMFVPEDDSVREDAALKDDGTREGTGLKDDSVREYAAPKDDGVR